MRILETSPTRTGYHLDTQEAEFLMRALSDEVRKEENSNSNYQKTEISRERSMTRRIDKLENCSGDTFDQVESTIIDDKQNVKEDKQHKYVETHDSFKFDADPDAQHQRSSFVRDIQSRHLSEDSSYLSSNESSDNSPSLKRGKIKKRKKYFVYHINIGIDWDKAKSAFSVFRFSAQYIYIIIFLFNILELMKLLRQGYIIIC